MNTTTVPQVDTQGRLRHLLTVDGLPADLIREILDRTATFLPDPGAPPRCIRSCAAPRAAETEAGGQPSAGAAARARS